MAVDCFAHLNTTVDSYVVVSNLLVRATTLLIPVSSFWCFGYSLHTVHDEEKPFELEMAWICDDSQKHFVKVPKDLLQEADKAAKDALNSDM